MSGASELAGDASGAGGADRCTGGASGAGVADIMPVVLVAIAMVEM